MTELTVGRIGRPHGLRGEVTVDIRTDDPRERFAVGASLRTEPAARGPLTVASFRIISGLNVVRFDGFDDRNAAETLRGTMLVVDIEALPVLTDEDEFYDHELIGLTAHLRAPDGGRGEVIGTVTELLHLPANDVLVVATDRMTAGEVLIPFVKVVVPVVDVASGVVVIDPPDGLFE